MTNKKKIILFLGAISLVAFGNYRQFIDNNKGKTTVEGKASEKATSSKGGKTVEKTVPPAKNNQNKTDNSKNQDSKKIQQKESERLKIDKNKDVESQFKLNTPNKGKESENDDSSSGK